MKPHAARSPTPSSPAADAVDPARQWLLLLVERLARTVSVARALVVSGRRLDLTGIDDGIGILCAKTLDLDPAQARQMRPHLLEMRAQIDRLAAALRQDAPEPARDSHKA